MELAERAILRQFRRARTPQDDSLALPSSNPLEDQKPAALGQRSQSLRLGANDKHHSLIPESRMGLALVSWCPLRF
jgi:hypothetical protein